METKFKYVPKSTNQEQQVAANVSQRQEIKFKMSISQSVEVRSNTNYDDLLQTLLPEFKPSLVIMNFGGAGGVKTLSEQRKAQLLESYKTVVNHASSIPGSIIIDGGTKSGVMELMGKAYSASANKQNTALVGVVPASKVTWPSRLSPTISKERRQTEDRGRTQLDPNHPQFLFATSNSGSWGSETETMFAFAEYLVTKFKIPICCIVANGGKNSLKEVTFALERKYPLIIIEKSGFLADEVALLHHRKEGESLNLQLLPHLEGSRCTSRISNFLTSNRDSVFFWSLDQDTSELNVFLSKYK